MININNIKLNFGTQIIFDGITCLIPDRSRIGIVGNNGTGKTTLLKAITGKVYFDTGTIEIQKKLRVGYLPQEEYEIDDINIIEYLKASNGIIELENKVKILEYKLAVLKPDSDGYQDILTKYEMVLEEVHFKEVYSFEAKTKRILKGLGFKTSDHTMTCGQFSGGWKRRILLANILLANPDIMLLDEPTNHLDTESMEWLENYLKNYQGTLIAVSHNRRFLDKMVTRVFELFQKKLTIYKGNYSYYLKEKDRRIEALKKEMALQKSEIKKITTFIERFRYKASKAHQVQERIKTLEKFNIIELEKKSKNVKIRFPSCEKSGQEVIKVENVSKQYGDNVVFKKVDFTIDRGERVSIVGVNGAGKSTLSRLLCKNEDPTTGNVTHGFKVSISFFSQESSENLNFSNTIWDEVIDIRSDCSIQEKRNLLGAFLFSGENIHKPISVLSGGEKSRLALLKLLLKDSNILVLDEPTNHLDFATRDIFQKALMNYDGTVIIVSHDRFFLDMLVERVIEIRDEKAHLYHGNYSRFLAKREELLALDLENPPVKETVVKEKKVESVRFKSKDLKRIEAEKRKKLSETRKELKSVEKKIEKLEKEKTEIETELCLPETNNDPQRIKILNQKLKQITSDMALTEARWEEVIIILESQ